mmetsp:Transcript_11632/g.32810  ORF Transcript_11632/g.32810 Transcript_11632/m.32810 type:complete len:251 (-) Transcript_11632:80-832(-)
MASSKACCCASRVSSFRVARRMTTSISALKSALMDTSATTPSPVADMPLLNSKPSACAMTLRCLWGADTKFSLSPLRPRPEEEPEAEVCGTATCTPKGTGGEPPTRRVPTIGPEPRNSTVAVSPSPKLVGSPAEPRSSSPSASSTLSSAPSNFDTAVRVSRARVKPPRTRLPVEEARVAIAGSRKPLAPCGWPLGLAAGLTEPAGLAGAGRRAFGVEPALLQISRPISAPVSSRSSFSSSHESGSRSSTR